MRKESTESTESRPEWEQIGCEQVQRLIQELLEEEVTGFWEGEVFSDSRTTIPASERIRQSPEA